MLSHMMWINGFTIKYIKYKAVNTCPICSYGASTGQLPIQVKIKKIPTKNQNKI